MWINSDDPGFWGSTGVTLDYAYAAIAWDLDLKELKQFAINGIKYSTLSEADKEECFNKFYESWREWTKSLAN
jgi:adenosine deaminase